MTGWRRALFSLAGLGLVAGIYLLNPSFRSLPARVLGFFGEGCYSIYLLHPLVASAVVLVSGRLGLGRPLAYGLSACITMVVSGLTFRYLEKPMMARGKVIAAAGAPWLGRAGG